MTTATALYISTPLTLVGTERVVMDRASDGVTGAQLSQAIADLFKGTKGADIASATTTDIGAATGMFIHVTGTTTITGLGTAAAGITRLVTFDGALLLTYNATSLILPTSANITTVAGDSALFVSEGSGNWRCVGYWRRDGTPLSIGISIPQNSQSAAYTLVLSDAGKHIYHPSADTTARTWTIPANASVAFPIGTAVTFDNDAGAGAITIAITSDTLVLVGAAGSTGSRTLASGGQATALKVTATRWRISGGAELT